jgi:hypothetical protein
MVLSATFTNISVILWRSVFFMEEKGGPELDAKHQIAARGRCGRDRIVVGFTTICTISAYHH